MTDRPAKLRDRASSETGWQHTVIETAELYGWAHMHVRKMPDGKGGWLTPTSCAGWPDLLFWRERLLAVELKTNTGRLTPDQSAVLASLDAAGVETHVWRPRDWDDVTAALSGRAPEDVGRDCRRTGVE